MSRRTRDLVKSGILERCAESGLGAACADAQADGVPCSAPDRECISCDRAAAVSSQDVPAPPSPTVSTRP